MTSFENAAELKRHFQLHSSQLYDTSLQSWVGGRSFKGHSYNSPCSKMAMDITFARVLRTTLPPTRQCKVVKLTPLRSVPHQNPQCGCCVSIVRSRPQKRGKNVCSGDLYPYADCQESSVASGCSVVLAAGSTWRSRTVKADDGSHCALVSQRLFSIFFFLRESKTSVFFFFLRFWLFLSSSRFQDGFLR